MNSSKLPTSLAKARPLAKPLNSEALTIREKFRNAVFMEIKVVYLGGTRGLTGTSEESLSLSEDSLNGHQLLERIFEQCPKLREHATSLRLAVNFEFVELDAKIPNGAEVALVPPVQGGAPRALVTEEKLEPLDAWHAVSHERAGATVLFIGTVRNHSRGKSVERLEYEAYVPMVEKTLEKISSECGEAHTESQTFIAHRYGTLEIGDASVVIASSAPHRAEAFDACRQAIESIKTDVPIFKREKTTDGDEWVGFGGG